MLIFALHTAIMEIIETYWNVNRIVGLIRFQTYIEIIETYWNVNISIDTISVFLNSEIIETYWNVNSSLLNKNRTFFVK